MKGRLEIELITPLFIGNGEKYSPVEYVLDRGTFNPINMEKFLEDNLYQKSIYSNLLDGMSKGSIDFLKLCRENRIDYKNYVRFTLSSPDLKKPQEVIRYIKSGGKVYIPGSSIKGALRSTLTKYAVNSESDLKLFTKTIMNSQTGASNSRDDSSGNKHSSKTSAKTLDDEGDGKIFGITYNSPFRLVSISDSDMKAPDVLKIYDIKILNVCNGRIKWFNRPGNNVDYPEDARSFFMEGIAEENSFSSVMSVNEASSYIISESGIKNAGIVFNFVSEINEEIKKYISSEYDFFRKFSNSRDLKAVIDFYGGLLDKAEKLEENEFLLQVGFGTGMLSKTIIQYLDDDMKSKIAQISRHRHYDKMYPKTRRIVFENGKAKCVPGWIKCRLLTA